MVTIKFGKPVAYIEFDNTGTSIGTIWSILDRSNPQVISILEINKKYHLKILYEDKIIFDDNVKLLDYQDIMKHEALRHYLKRHNYSDFKICFAGVNVRNLPINIDLSWWYRMFFTENEKFTVELTERNL